MNTVTVSFNTTVRHKWPKCLSDKKTAFRTQLHEARHWRTSGQALVRLPREAERFSRTTHKAAHGRASSSSSWLRSALRWNETLWRHARGDFQYRHLTKAINASDNALPPRLRNKTSSDNYVSTKRPDEWAEEIALGREGSRQWATNKLKLQKAWRRHPGLKQSVSWEPIFCSWSFSFDSNLLCTP